MGNMTAGALNPATSPSPCGNAHFTAAPVPDCVVVDGGDVREEDFSLLRSRLTAWCVGKVPVSMDDSIGEGQESRGQAR